MFCTVIAAAAAVVGSAVAAAVWPCWSRPCPPLPPPPWCWGLMFLWPLLWPWPTPIVETWGMILVTLPTALVRPSRKTKRCPVFKYSGCLTNLKKRVWSHLNKNLELEIPFNIINFSEILIRDVLSKRFKLKLKSIYNRQLTKFLNVWRLLFGDFLGLV